MYTTVLFLTLLLIFQIVNGQKYNNPAKNLSLSRSSDIADTAFSFKAHDLSVNSSGALLGFSESANIHTLQASNLKDDHIYCQETAQRLLTFNPVILDQTASVGKNNQIEIRDIKRDTVLLRINAHLSKIVWLGYDPTGKLLVSLDEKGHLFTWVPSLKQCIAQLKGIGGIPVFQPNGNLNVASRGDGEEPGFVKYSKKLTWVSSQL